jgi:hypothetical protein
LLSGLLTSLLLTSLLLAGLLLPLARLLLLAHAAALRLLTALLACLSRLRLSARLARLALLATTQLLALTLLALHLFHLLAELLGFAAQHLLLPALLGGRLLILLGLVGQFLLAACERFQLLHGFIDLLLLRARGRGLLRAVALVLVLLRVELEIEESFEIARAPGPAATAAATLTVADCHFTDFSLSTAGPIASTACSMSFTKLLNESPASVSWRAFMRSPSDFAWSRSFDCWLERNAAFSASLPLAPPPLI